MELFNKQHKNLKTLPAKETWKLAQDSYQLFCAAVISINQKCREMFKGDPDVKFHKICKKDYPMSVSEFLGDKLDSDLKDMDAAKKIKLNLQKFIIS